MSVISMFTLANCFILLKFDPRYYKRDERKSTKTCKIYI